MAITPQWNTYLQLATAADPPAGVLSTASLANVQDFDLARGRQVEWGTKYERADGRASGTLAAYRIVRENLAIADPSQPGQTLPVGQQSARGMEATFAVQPADDLMLQGNLAWVDATLDDFYESASGVSVSRAGNRPTNTPSRVANAWLDWQFAPSRTAGLDARAVSSRYADAANRVSSAGYGLLGASLRWDVDASTQIALRVRNLSDRTYVAYALSPTMAYLGEPRSLELSARWNF